MENILNYLNIPIYVSDLVTNEILYANTALLRLNENRQLVGRICWEALQDEAKRCQACPIPYLLKHPGEGYQREVYNGKYQKIYDCIIPWANGKLAHLQYRVDMN